MLMLGSVFGSLLCKVLELSECLWTPKTFKLLFVHTLWEKQVCCVFESLNCPRGLILPFSWADLAPKIRPRMGTKIGPKSGPASERKMIPKIVINK
jgi:hypothetical protein